LGLHGGRPQHGDRLLQLERRVPIVATGTGTPERIVAAFDVTDELTGERGPVTSEPVPAVRAAQGHRD
jgi:PII-like signaling protein